MPFDPKSAKKAGKKSKRGPAKKERPSLQFEEGIEKTVKWYLDNKEWMDRVTSGDYQEYYKKI